MTVYDLIRLLAATSDPYAQAYIDHGESFREAREVLYEVDEDGTPRVRIRV